MTEPIKSPEPMFYLSTGQEIKMTYGLLNRVAKVVKHVENVGLLLVDLTMQEMALCTVLSTYDAKGKLLEEVAIEGIMTTPEETHCLLAWVTEHLTHFFLKNLLSGEKVVGQFQRMAEQSLERSQTGSAS